MAIATIGVPAAADKWDIAILQTAYSTPHKPFKVILYTDTQVSAAKRVWPTSWQEMIVDARKDPRPEGEEDCPLWDLI